MTELYWPKYTLRGGFPNFASFASATPSTSKEHDIPTCSSVLTDVIGDVEREREKWRREDVACRNS